MVAHSMTNAKIGRRCMRKSYTLDRFRSIRILFRLLLDRPIVAMQHRFHGDSDPSRGRARDHAES
ncbi:hypothetical protein GGR44_002974 [Sphingobium fontiphilum]|uniref:Uncharacterized protein n=1 Tax=Sphingobium fontiphilum TaxID=944425 RepID=A0A7W6DHA9_9SPHN|nr:hypothetical protein [Sphingobium fontiphilum]